MPAAWRASEELGPRPFTNEHPFNAIRKMACSYGWDWGPTLATSGIWRPIRLVGWRTARLAGVRPLVDVRGTTGLLQVQVDVARAPGADGPLTLTAEVGGRSAAVDLDPGATTGNVSLEVDDVARWWPVGHGDQPLHPVRVALSDADADAVTALDTWSGDVGFRTVALDTTPDAEGTPFRLVVNDVPVFARGLNWIPDDCFPTRVSAERYATRLSEAVDVGANLVRVWGGGLYESDDFYAVCDRLGLLVWQDFLFACAAYAEEDPLRSEVEAEAREAVTRLSPHPSLVLWNGNNENIWGHADWGWETELQGASWGWGYYTDLLPGLVAELDGTRPYCPGTPYGMDPDVPPNDPAHGPTHLWDVWNSLDYAHYRDSVPRFVAEFGWQAPPTWTTQTRAGAHQKAADGELKLSRGLAPHLLGPGSAEDEHWAMSLNQAHAVSLGVEHLRSWSPTCSGAIWWQLNDCWPVTSWAVVDGDGRRKPAWYALRRAFADRLVTVQPRGDGPRPGAGERHRGGVVGHGAGGPGGLRRDLARGGGAAVRRPGPWHGDPGAAAGRGGGRGPGARGAGRAGRRAAGLVVVRGGPGRGPAGAGPRDPGPRGRRRLRGQRDGTGPGQGPGAARGQGGPGRAGGHHAAHPAARRVGDDRRPHARSGGAGGVPRCAGAAVREPAGGLVIFAHWWAARSWAENGGPGARFDVVSVWL